VETKEELCPKCKCRKGADIHQPGYSCDYYLAPKAERFFAHRALDQTEQRAAEAVGLGKAVSVVLASEAERLERELAAAKAENERLKEFTSWEVRQEFSAVTVGDVREGERLRVITRKPTPEDLEALDDGNITRAHLLYLLKNIAKRASAEEAT
jgi:hypothetical protein